MVDQQLNGTAMIRQTVKIEIEPNKEGRFHSFFGLQDNKEHIAIGLGEKNQKIPLVRIHSECLTGDVFNSRRCDCGWQLKEAIERIQNHGGYILYLRQEGRGIGLYNKLDAYCLQDQGFDTYTANNLLNFPDDMRNFFVASQMLKALGYTTIKLLSNNPNKKNQIERYGINVIDVLSTNVYLFDSNKGYLEAKKHKHNHTLDLEG